MRRRPSTAAQHVSHQRHLITTSPSPTPKSRHARDLELQQTLLHLAAVNGAPDGLTANPTALAAWGVALASRAHALRIVASGVRGWSLELPGGGEVAPGAPGCGLALVRGLLAARGAGGRGGGRRSDKQQKRKQQRGAGSKDEEEEGRREQAGGKRRKSGVAAAAAVAAERTPKRQLHGGGSGGGAGALKTPVASAGSGKNAAAGGRQPAAPATGSKQPRQSSKGTPAAAKASVPAASDTAKKVKKARAPALLMTPQPAKGKKAAGKQRLSL
jgi:hypothetical protein